jgi:microcystin-dependent protein
MAGPPATGAPVPTLALGQYLAQTGLFPSPENGPASAFTLGMIHTYAGVAGGWVPSPFNMPHARGQMRLVKGLEPLFSILLTTYGGDGFKNFNLPNLQGLMATQRLPEGTPVVPPAGTAPVMWLIATKGSVPPPPPAPPQWPPGVTPLPEPSFPPPAQPGLLQTGMLTMFAGSEVPGGWLACDGSEISAADHPELYAVIGGSFGWLPGGIGALPRLTQSVIVGPPPGIVPGQTRPYWPGDDFESVPNALCLQWLICTTGTYPAAPEPGHFSNFSPYAGFLGQVVAYAGKDVPEGWAACDGSLLSISAYQELFVLLNNAYGGDGETSFALPDLSGTTIVGG